MPKKVPETVTPETLKGVAKSLRKRANELTALSLRMENNQVESVQALGMKMTRRALTGIDGLIKSCNQEIGEI